jgi:hypothetical protein
MCVGVRELKSLADDAGLKVSMGVGLSEAGGDNRGLKTWICSNEQNTICLWEPFKRGVKEVVSSFFKGDAASFGAALCDSSQVG